MLPRVGTKGKRRGKRRGWRGREEGEGGGGGEGGGRRIKFPPMRFFHEYLMINLHHRSPHPHLPVCLSASLRRRSD